MSQKPRTLEQIQAENLQLKEALRRLQEEQKEKKQITEREPEGNKAEYERRVQQNSLRLRELQGLVSSQEEVISEYKNRFQEFQENLGNVMKLDKDIHARLVSPQSSAALETNVRNVLTALKGGAPYDRLLKMMESIKV